ncbi:MAG: O-antigen ligase family protein [Clostridia bacterium]|nr:O-antigen ligase family protein [Clostridia bacterium]
MNFNIEPLVNKYFISTLAVSASVYIQFVLYRYLGAQVGFVFIWGQGSRVIYNSIYVAKSILSLYLSVGMIYYFIKLFDKVTIKRLFCIVFIGGAVLINNSRTGVMCFMIVALIYAFVHIRKIGRNVLLIPFAAVGIFALAYVINTMLSTRSGLSDFSDDNGRIDLLVNASRQFKNYIITGIGGSEKDYLRLFGDPTPIHNFVIQYMLQFGMVSGLLIMIIYFVPLLRTSGIYKYLTGIIVLGGMFFANWHNALFLFPLMILALIKTSDEQFSKERSVVNEEK